MDEHSSARRAAQESLAPFGTCCRVESLTAKMESIEGRELTVRVVGELGELGEFWQLDVGRKELTVVTSLVTPVEVVDPTETGAEVAVIDDEGETINIPEPVHLLPSGP